MPCIPWSSCSCWLHVASYSNVRGKMDYSTVIMDPQQLFVHIQINHKIEILSTIYFFKLKKKHNLYCRRLLFSPPLVLILWFLDLGLGVCFEFVFFICGVFEWVAVLLSKICCFTKFDLNKIKLVIINNWSYQNFQTRWVTWFVRSTCFNVITGCRLHSGKLI